MTFKRFKSRLAASGHIINNDVKINDFGNLFEGNSRTSSSLLQPIFPSAISLFLSMMNGNHLPDI